MAAQLTPGAVSMIYNGQAENARPRVQVIDIKTLGQAGERVRVIISDGQHFLQSLLAPQLNQMVTMGKLTPFCIVELGKHLLNPVKHDNQKTMKIAIIMQLEVVDPGPGHKIGAPVNIDGQPQAQQQQQQQAPQSGGYGGGGVSAKYESQAPHAGFGGGGGGSSGVLSNTPIHPISALNPYQSKWTIKARVTAKSEIRTWNNDRGTGKLFSVDLLDESGGEIRATMFQETCNKLFPVFQINQVYLISNGHVKPANKRFSRLNNDYELTLNMDADVRHIGQDNSIAQQRYDFVGIRELSATNPQTTEFADVVGVVLEVGAPMQFTAKASGKQLTKRSVQLADRSQCAMEFTLWNQEAEKYDEQSLPRGTILAAKNAKLNDFGGSISLTTGFNAQIFLNPEHEEAQALRVWWDAEGKNVQNWDYVSRNPNAPGGQRVDVRKHFSQIKDENLGHGEKPSYFLSRGTISYFKDDINRPPWYKACPSQEHNPKVTDNEQGSYFCERCNKTYPNYQPRYILSMMASDASGSTWMTAFDEAATIILGKPASDLVPMQEMNDEPAFKQVFADAHWKQYMFKVAAKAEAVQDGMRVRCRVVDVQPVDYRAESRYLLDEIAKYD